MGFWVAGTMWGWMGLILTCWRLWVVLRSLSCRVEVRDSPGGLHTATHVEKFFLNVSAEFTPGHIMCYVSQRVKDFSRLASFVAVRLNNLISSKEQLLISEYPENLAYWSTNCISHFTYFLQNTLKTDYGNTKPFTHKTCCCCC